MSDEMTRLEQAVLQKLLSGDLPTLQVLRSQAEAAQVVERTYTGSGFNIRLQVPDGVPRVPPPRDFRIGDVDAEVVGLEHGAGFLLFVSAGELDRLEGYSYEEPWPDTIDSFELRYRRLPRELELGFGR